MFDDTDEPNHGIDLNSEDGQAYLDLRDAASPSGGLSSPMSTDQQDILGRNAERFSNETPSPSSGIIVNSLVNVIFHALIIFKCLSSDFLANPLCLELLLNFYLAQLFLL